MEMKQDQGLKAQVEVRDLDSLEVAYVRHIGPYQGDNELFDGLIQKLMTWAGPRELVRFPESRLLAVYHDSPEITDEDKLRTSICLTVPPETKAEGEIGRMNLPGGKYAVARFEIAPDQYQAAWDTVYGGWLPESGFQPDDRAAMEFYLGDPKEHPEGKHTVEICLPVKPM
jgi:AraC family transcriptional regulator